MSQFKRCNCVSIHGTRRPNSNEHKRISHRLPSLNWVYAVRDNCEPGAGLHVVSPDWSQPWRTGSLVSHQHSRVSVVDRDGQRRSEDADGDKRPSLLWLRPVRGVRDAPSTRSGGGGSLTSCVRQSDVRRWRVMLGDVLVIGVGELAGEAALLADVQLATSLLVAVRLVHAVQLALVRLERTALSERLVTPTTAVRTNSCTPRQQPALKPSSHRSSHLI